MFKPSLPRLIDDDLVIRESQNLLEDDGPSTVLLLAGDTESLLLFAAGGASVEGVEDVIVAILADDVTLH